MTSFSARDALSLPMCVTMPSRLQNHVTLWRAHTGYHPKPKHHALVDLSRLMSRFGNPSLWSTYSDETLNSTISRLSHTVHPAHFALAILKKYYVQRTLKGCLSMRLPTILPQSRLEAPGSFQKGRGAPPRGIVLPSVLTQHRGTQDRVGPTLQCKLRLWDPWLQDPPPSGPPREPPCRMGAGGIFTQNGQSCSWTKIWGGYWDDWVQRTLW